MKLFHRIAITTLGVVLAGSSAACLALCNRGDAKMAKAADTYEYNLYSGTLTAGDYILYYNGKAMKNTISSSRFNYLEVTPTSNKITTDDTSIVWTLAVSGDYWTIYSGAVSKYAASTGGANKAALETDGTIDKSLWKVTGSSTYDFENKANKAASVNAMLRNNGTYGFACYAAGTGGALSLYKKGNKVTNVPATGVSITASKTSLDYSEELQLSATVTPNDATDKSVTWSSSDPNAVSVDNTGKIIAVGEGSSVITASANGGESVTDTVTITSNMNNTNAYVDVLNRATTGISGNSYTPWSGKSATNASHSTTVYQGNTNGANDSIGISDANNRGFVVSNPYGLAKKVAVSWNSNSLSSRTLNIVGSNSAINLDELTKETETVATLVHGTSSEVSLGAGYRFLGFISSNGALYLNSIAIYWDANLVPSVDLSGDTNVVLGDTATFTATRTNSSDEIKWYINDVLVESGISVDGNTSTMQYTPSAAGDDVIKVILGSDVDTKTLTLHTIAKKVFEKVTALSQITDGSQVILVGKKTVDEVEHTYVANRYTAGDYLTSTEARMEGNDIVAIHTTAIFTVNYVADNGYTFEDGGKYLDATGGTNNNQLKETSSPTAQYWNLDFDPEKNLLTNVNVTESENTFRGYARFNTTSNGFSCYQSATQHAIELYKLKAPASDYYAEDFAQDFLDATDSICAASDHGNKTALTSVWNTFKTTKLGLLDSDNILVLKETVADESGDVIARAMARYDHICKAYSFENFLNRSSANHLNHISILNINGGNGTLLIAIMSTVVVISLAGVFFIIRKRKHQ